MDGVLNRLLVKIAILHRNAAAEALSRIGLHAGQANVLFCLWAEDGRSQAALTRDLGIAPPTVNVLVGKLEKAGYVESRACTEDKRLKRVFLTAKGNSVKGQAEAQMLELERAILRGFSEIERNSAALILEMIERNLVSLFEEESGEAAAADNC